MGSETLHAAICGKGKPDLSIWAFSYIGHDSEAPAFLPTGKMGCAIHSHISLALVQVVMKTDITFVFSGQTYILEDQILHKLELLEKLIPRSAKITLIGHSIGCKVIMEVFKRNTSHQIQGNCPYL